MTAPARRLRPARPAATCAACRQPMVWLGEATHPNCEPDTGIPARGEQRQLRLDEGGDQRVAP